MNKQNKKTIFLSVIFCLFTALLCQAGLEQKINTIVNQYTQKGAEFSISIKRADTGQTLYAHNPKKSLIPASNMKIIITAVALDVLGPQYKFTTSIGISGDDLIIKGSGDPLLGDHETDRKYDRPRNWVITDAVSKIHESGIQTIDNIIIDTTVFDNNRVHPSWPKDQLNRWYAAEVGGLNYNRNCVEMITEKKGSRVDVKIVPETSFIQIDNEVRAISSGSGAVGAYRTPRPNHLKVKGKCRTRQGPFEVAIEQPAAFFGYMLAEKLAAEGIDLKGKLIEKEFPDDTGVNLLSKYETSIQDCLTRSNKDSLQLAAECLLKSISASKTPCKAYGSWQSGRSVITNYLLELGINKTEIYIDDGSGLSRKNRLSANSISTLLCHLYKTGVWPFFEKSLAVGGVDGTIRRYFRQPAYKEKILGKTGYIKGVKSFSGICRTDNGDYIFSIIANQFYSSRKPINDIAEAIIDEFNN